MVGSCRSKTALCRENEKRRPALPGASGLFGASREYRWRTNQTGRDGGVLSCYTVRIHADGTVTFWSVYEQVWHHRAEVVPDAELAAMTSSERERIAARPSDSNNQDLIDLCRAARR